MSWWPKVLTELGQHGLNVKIKQKENNYSSHLGKCWSLLIAAFSDDVHFLNLGKNWFSLPFISVVLVVGIGYVLLSLVRICETCNTWFTKQEKTHYYTGSNNKTGFWKHLPSFNPSFGTACNKKSLIQYTVYSRGVKLIFIQGPHTAQFDLRWAGRKEGRTVGRKEGKMQGWK